MPSRLLQFAQLPPPVLLAPDLLGRLLPVADDGYIYRHDLAVFVIFLR